MKNIYFFIQIRMGSTRLPGKVMMPIFKGMRLVDLVYNRIGRSKYFSPENTFFLTSRSSSDDPLVEYFKSQKWNYFRGDETNVFFRFYQACQRLRPEFFFRICADNPFIEPLFLDEIADYVSKYPQVDYVSYSDSRGNPVIKTHYGFFTELVSGDTFLELNADKIDKLTREHVTSIFYQNPEKYRVKLLAMPGILSDERVRLTIDTREDLEIAIRIVEKLKLNFDIYNVYTFLQKENVLYDLMREQIHRSPK